MPEQPFVDFSKGAASSFSRALNIVPDDNTDLVFESRALHMGSAGDVRVITADGDTVVLRSLLAGVMYPIAVHRILATGTTATDIVALA